MTNTSPNGIGAKRSQAISVSHWAHALGLPLPTRKFFSSRNLAFGSVDPDQFLQCALPQRAESCLQLLLLGSVAAASFHLRGLKPCRSMATTKSGREIDKEVIGRQRLLTMLHFPN